MTRDEAIQVLQTALTSPFIYGEYADAIDMAIEALTQGSRKVTQESTQDLISRRDAIEAVRTAKAVFDTTLEPYIKPQDAVDALSALPSAEARPTVIRSRTLLPTKDFMEWAKRIREINPNAVVIPCDAEAPSAEARPTGEWLEVEVFPEVYDIEGVKTWGSEMQCDQCGFRFMAIEGHIRQYNYCPNCGTRMGGDEG